MERLPRASTVTTLVAALVLGTASVVNGGAAEPPTVELQVGVHSNLDPSNLELARNTATALLTSARIAAHWRDCGVEACTAAPAGVVLVHVLSISKMTDAAASAEVVRDGRTGIPTVLVYLPRIAELTRAIRRGSESRSTPVFATLEVGHLVGLAIAHEVGHALGLAHAPVGIMKARPSLDEILALRTSRLAFQKDEGERMRMALVTRSDSVVARAR